MLDAPQGAKLVSFHAVVTRAGGLVEDLGLIDHSHAWLFAEHELAAMCHAASHLENLLDLRRRKEPGAVLVPTFDKQVFSARMIGSSPATAEPLNIAFGQGDPAGTRVTALASDKALAGEIVANGAQTTRVAGTSSQQTTTNPSDTYKVVGTITCNLGGGLQIVEAGLFTTSAFPGQTTVATLGALSGTATGTTTLTSGSGLPTASTDYQVDQEIITGTLAATTLTISARGANASTAAAHSGTPTITVAAPTGTGAEGYMACKGDFALISLAQNDSLQLTATIQFT